MPTMTTRRASAPLHGFKALVGEPEGSFEGVVAVFNNIDLVGDRILPGAFAKSLSRWATSGDPIPVLWSHQWDNLDAHVGSVLEAAELYPGDERLPDELKDLGGLWVKARMDLDEDFPTRLWKRMKSRRIKEFSFAYDVMPGGERRAGDGANDLTELDLIEVGPCLKGVNTATSLIDVKAMKTIAHAFVPKDDDPDRCILCGLTRMTSGHLHTLARPAGGAKAAISSHETGTSDAAWDGPANEANLSNDDGADVYREAYAWVDPEGDPDVKNSYKFIHHFVSDAGAVGDASTTACSTGIGVLNGGRGGADIPDGDRQGVYNHLAKHLRDAEMEPPELASSGQSSAGAGGTKAIVTLDGSMEQRQESILREIYAIDRQTLDSMANGGLYAPWLEATYDDRAIVLMEGWDDPAFEGRYWQFPVTVDADGTVSLGDPVEVTVSGTVTPKARAKALKASARPTLNGRDSVKTGGNPEDPGRGNGEDHGEHASATGTGEANRLLLELDLLELS